MSRHTCGVKPAAWSGMRVMGWVPQRQLCREIDAAFDNWLDRHPERRNGSGSFVQAMHQSAKRSSPMELAKAYLAMGSAASRGTLQRMATGAKVNYTTLHKAVVKLRLERRRAKGLAGTVPQGAAVGVGPDFLRGKNLAEISQ